MFRRAKLSHDPNNTAWSRSTTTFGHRILTAQGWQPGDYLGIKDAPHAKLHTEANASHIRFALKDDHLGLGAKRGSGQSQGQCTGLDAFQGLLGRLNGKTEGDLEKEQKSRDDMKQAIYIDNRWGTVHFVSGGLLVGDQIQKLAGDEVKRPTPSLPIKSDGQARISLRPRRVAEGDMKIALVTIPVSPSDEANYSTKPRRRNTLDAEGPDRPEPVSRGKPEAYDRNEAKDYISSPGKTQSLHAALESLRPKLSDPDKPQRKAERKRRKQDRELRRASRKSRPAQDANQSTGEGVQELPQVERIHESVTIPPSVAQPATARPRSQSIVGGRHAVRQRYIQHKKMAMMDPKALNEVSWMCSIWIAPNG